MPLSQKEQNILNASVAKSGNVVYVGNNNVGPRLERQLSGKYAVSSKKTARLSTDPHAGQPFNLSGRNNVTGPNYASLNNLNKNNNVISTNRPSGLRRGTMQRTAVRHHATNVTNEPSSLRRGTMQRTAVRGKPSGGARKKTRKHKKESRESRKLRKSRKSRK